jgi:hypothetical protein
MFPPPEGAGAGAGAAIMVGIAAAAGAAAAEREALRWFSTVIANTAAMFGTGDLRAPRAVCQPKPLMMMKESGWRRGFTKGLVCRLCQRFGFGVSESELRIQGLEFRVYGLVFPG